MGCSLRSVVNFGILLAVLDLLHGLATVGFYGYQLANHYRCHWNHGIPWCYYYIYETNHSLRVNYGIGEGIIGVFFTALLIIGLCKFQPWLTWLWILKALAVIGLNSYFIIGWVIKKSRYYHSLWERRNYDQENAFLFAGIGLTLIECFIMFIFCCVSGSFTYKVRKQRIPNMETYI